MSEDWKDSIPEPLRDAPYFKAAESVDQVLADLQNAAQHMGNSIRLPGEDGDIDGFRAKLSERVPGLFEHDVQVAEPIREFPEDAPEDIVAAAKELNLTADQFQLLVDRRLGDVEALSQARDETHRTLREMWSSDMESNVSLVESFLSKSNAPGSMVQAYAEGRLGAEELVWLHQQAAAGIEEAQFGDHVGKSPAPPDATAARRALDEKIKAATPGSPAWNRLMDQKVELLGRIGSIRKAG